jgi:hypothetical protein
MVKLKKKRKKRKKKEKKYECTKLTLLKVWMYDYKSDKR